MRIGAEIRGKRRAAGLTLAELGRRASVSRFHLCNVERGRRGLSTASLERVLRVLSDAASPVRQEEGQ